MFRKIHSCGQETQKKFIKGVNVLDELVGGTLGPSGKNRVIQRKYKAPLVTNDGVTVARHVVLDDVIEDLAVQTIVEVALKTNEQAGDGTTSSVVMASELVRHCLKLQSKGSLLEGGVDTNPMSLWRQIQEEKTKAVDLLKKKAKKLSDKDLDNIIATSLEDLEYGKTLAELLRTVGKDGYISTEDNWATKYGITTEVTTGMRFLGTYASPYLATEKNAKEALWEDTYVLTTNHKLESVQQIKDLLKELGEKGARKLVIIGGYSEGEAGFSKEFIETVAKAIQALFDPRIKDKSSIIQVLAVKAPSLTSAELEDVAIATGGNFIDKNLGVELQTVKLEHLGFASKVSVTEDEVNILGGKGDTKQRVEVLKEQLERERDQMFKEKLKRRIASLSSGVGIIRVGASTESERSYLKYKLEDAVNAARAAMEEGYVKGAGLALVDIAEELGKDSVLYSTLNAPYKRIVDNAGGNLRVPAKVIDPLKVVRLALENACSGAGMLITSDGAIAEEKMTYNDYLEKVMQKMVPRDERDDFRDSENQDQGAGRLID